MRIYIMVWLAVFLFQGQQPAQTVSDQVVSALARNDMGSLLTHFHSMVDLQIPGTDGDFSNTQTAMVLRKFFADHPVSSVKITKEGIHSDNSCYSLGELVSGSQKYRLYFVTREAGGKHKVHLFQLTEIF
ncbi:MAG: DUF4783 domain-containing protein [bacterium]